MWWKHKKSQEQNCADTTLVAGRQEGRPLKISVGRRGAGGYLVLVGGGALGFGGTQSHSPAVAWLLAPPSVT